MKRNTKGGIVIKQSWNVVKPVGLFHWQLPLHECKVKQALDNAWDFYKTVDWFKRFGKQYPNTAHPNGHHAMASDNPAIADLVRMAISFARTRLASHPMLECMESKFEDVSVATMRHKGAERIPSKIPGKTKCVRPSWGLGAHPDTFATWGDGLVLMVCLSDTKCHHRRFKFTMPCKNYEWTVSTPHGTVLVFTSDAYDAWEHESVRCTNMDGECISLTIRMKDIDSYYGWNVPEGHPSTDEMQLAKKQKLDMKKRSVSYARLMQAEYVKCKDAESHIWDARHTSQTIA